MLSTTLGGAEYASTPLRHNYFMDVAWELGKAQGLTVKTWAKINALRIVSDRDVWRAGTGQTSESAEDLWKGTPD